MLTLPAQMLEVLFAPRNAPLLFTPNPMMDAVAGVWLGPTRPALPLLSLTRNEPPLLTVIVVAAPSAPELLICTVPAAPSLPLVASTTSGPVKVLFGLLNSSTLLPAASD